MRRGCFLLWAAGKPAEAGAAGPHFEIKEVAASAWEAKWEILLPFVALAAIFGGFASLIEASALTVVYALVMQTLIHLCRIPPRAEVDEFPRR
jgi:TRAP-type C4-dicarboxylate transport system permease large subunit